MFDFKGIGGLMNIMTSTINECSIKPVGDKGTQIKESLSHNDNCMQNWIWYRGDPKELQQWYIRHDPTRFWGKTTGQSTDVKRIHSRLASAMVDAMAYVVLSDMRDITFETDEETELWKVIAKENNFNNLTDESLKTTLVFGDGAFKINYEEMLTDKPIIEFYRADRVEFVRHRGRIQEVIFKTKYKHNGHTYVLHERYGYGYILNTLYLTGTEVSMNSVPALAGVNDYYFAGAVGANGVVKKKGSYMLAVPFIIYSSSKYEGRGESIFDKRTSLLDALDHALSQWMECVEAGMPKTGVSEDMLKHDPNTGSPIIPDGLERYFLLQRGRNGDGLGSNGLGIETVQFDIPWQSYDETQSSFIDSILMGFISPATLGIDISKVDSGESMREKQTMTMHTRSYIVEAMSEVVKQLATVAMQSYYDSRKMNVTVSEPSVDFGDYASPTPDAMADTLTKCVYGGFMSKKTAIKEYHGDSKSDEWVDEEYRLIMEESNASMAGVGFPDFGGDVNYGTDAEDLAE